jgi:hypothetical protein
MSDPSHRIVRVVCGALALLGLASCADLPPSGTTDFTLDLRQAEGAPGQVLVQAEYPVVAGTSIVLKSFAQPDALPVLSLRARQAALDVPCKRRLDERKFAEWEVGPMGLGGSVIVDYTVRLGAVEEKGMSGRTGYCFGYLDRSFGVFSGRQLFLLPVDPSPPSWIRVRLLTREGWDLLAPWPSSHEPGRFAIDGPDASRRVLDGIVAAGRFDTAGSHPEAFRACALRDLPERLREESLDRAVALEQFLADHLGRPPHPYTLILVPKTPENLSISVPASTDAQVISLGKGLPTRWMTIASALARSYLADRPETAAVGDGDRWVLDSLPTLLAAEFEEGQGWKPVRAWEEQFYYSTGVFPIDLSHPDAQVEGSDPVKRQWRGALLLSLLSGEMQRGGNEPIPALCRRTLGAGRDFDWQGYLRDRVPPDLRDRLRSWLAADVYPFPFPGAGGKEERIRTVRRVPAALGASSRADLYLSGRTLGLLEQCGCRTRQMGGMGRRTTVLRRRLEAQPGGLVLELGDAIPFDHNAPLLDTQKTEESDLALSLLAGSGTRAMIIGYSELTYGSEFLRERTVRSPANLRWTSSNVRTERTRTFPWLDVRLGGRRARIIGLIDPNSYHLGSPLEFEDAIADVNIRRPAEAIGDALEQCGAGCLPIVAGPLGPTAVLELLESRPDLPIIVTDDWGRFIQDPRFRFERPLSEGFATAGLLGNTLIVVLRSDAYALVHLGLTLGDGGEIAGVDLEDLPLGDEVPDDPGVRRALDAHYAKLAVESGLSVAAPIGTGLRQKVGGTYVGAEICRTCHPSEYQQWKATEHSAAFATLLSKRRQGVPGCFACHVTGYRQPGGYAAISDRGLRNVQCEACHGPGSRHAASGVSGTIVRSPTAFVCRECHTLEHSEMSDINFAHYWEQVVHGPAAKVARKGS